MEYKLIDHTIQSHGSRGNRAVAEFNDGNLQYRLKIATSSLLTLLLEPLRGKPNSYARLKPISNCVHLNNLSF